MAGYKDGQPNTVQFNAPGGLAIDSNDNVYVADTLNQSCDSQSYTGRYCDYFCRSAG